jgi:hypothetical protein
MLLGMSAALSHEAHCKPSPLVVPYAGINDILAAVGSIVI